MIDQLPALVPDPARAARVIAKCHARMAPRPRRRIAEPALLTGFCVIYLSAIALITLEVFSVV